MAKGKKECSLILPITIKCYIFYLVDSPRCINSKTQFSYLLFCLDKEKDSSVIFAVMFVILELLFKLFQSTWLNVRKEKYICFLSMLL